jgi:hypothetical protein
LLKMWMKKAPPPHPTPKHTFLSSTPKSFITSF